MTDFPTQKIATDFIDSPADTPQQARETLEKMTSAIKQIYDSINDANGLCELISDRVNDNCLQDLITSALVVDGAIKHRHMDKYDNVTIDGVMYETGAFSSKHLKDGSITLQKLAKGSGRFYIDDASTLTKQSADSQRMTTATCNAVKQFIDTNFTIEFIPSANNCRVMVSNWTDAKAGIEASDIYIRNFPNDGYENDSTATYYDKAGLPDNSSTLGGIFQGGADALICGIEFRYSDRKSSGNYAKINNYLGGSGHQMRIYVIHMKG